MINYFSLSELLPPHLRDERVSASLHREVVTGWVNVFKSRYFIINARHYLRTSCITLYVFGRSISELVQRLNEMGYSYSTSRQLGQNQFKFDRVCPKFISLRPAIRSDLIRSSLLSESIIVLQVERIKILIDNILRCGFHFGFRVVLLILKL